VCPPWKDPDSGYVAQTAEACSYDAMLPTGFELDSGKRFSCECRCAVVPPCRLISVHRRQLSNRKLPVLVSSPPSHAVCFEFLETEIHFLSVTLTLYRHALFC